MPQKWVLKSESFPSSEILKNILLFFKAQKVPWGQKSSEMAKSSQSCLR